MKLEYGVSCRIKKIGAVETLLTELNVVSIEVEHLGASKDGHVLELSLSDSGAVVGDDHKLGLSVSQHLHDGLETCLAEKEKEC